MSREQLTSPSSTSWDESEVDVDVDDDSLGDFAPPRAPSVPPSSLPWVARGSLGASTHRHGAPVSRPANFPSAPTTLPSVDVTKHPAPTFGTPGLSPALNGGPPRSRHVDTSRSRFGGFGWARGKLAGLFSSSPPSARPDSGLDTLRPYVGSRPQIHVAGETRSRRTGRPVSRLYVVRGFTWGIALASVLFSAGVIHYRSTASSPETPLGRSLRVLDADALGKPKARVRSVAERAAEGDKEALSRLRKKPASARTPEEVAALALGDEVHERAHAKAAVEALAKQRSFTEADKAEFFRHAGNQRTFREALVAMSANESEVGPDLIYEVTRRHRHQKDIASFARALLFTPPVYKYASPALTVIIDAETLTECSDVRGLVERVFENGDARSVRHMAKFAKTTGCGEHGIQDCYRCLRGDRALVDALRAAQDRRHPY